MLRFDKVITFLPILQSNLLAFFNTKTCGLGVLLFSQFMNIMSIFIYRYIWLCYCILFEWFVSIDTNNKQFVWFRLINFLNHYQLLLSPCFFQIYSKLYSISDTEWDSFCNSNSSCHVAADILNLLLLYELFMFFHVL